MAKEIKNIPHLDWLNPLKAFALMAILLNHFVEEFGRGPWFTVPSERWPDFAARMANIFPSDHTFPISLIQFMGWLGDNAPGVFILASGFGLTWSFLHRDDAELQPLNFYKRRLLRIFPLYIVIHLIILALALFVPGKNYTLASPVTLLSIVGLRFTDGLFFYINPSWWFIWLIIQLYLLFPFLMLLLNRTGIRKFLVITLAFTFICRFSGLIGLNYFHNLSYWMMGIFFGTRLAEFTIGMVLAAYFFKAFKNNDNLPPIKKIFLYSIIFYIIGLGASFTWYGTIVSNILITLGMSGLFYTFWAGFIKRIDLLAGIVTWIGIESYSIYLLHQAPLKWTTEFFGGNNVEHFTVALIVIILSFPAGWLISKFVSKFQTEIEKFELEIPKRAFTWITCSGVLLALLLIEPIVSDLLKQRVFALILGVCLIWLVLMEFFSPDKETWIEQLIRWIAIFASFSQLFIFPPLYGHLALYSGVVFGIFALISNRKVQSRIFVWTLAFTGTILVFIGTEIILNKHFPIDAGRWGELPALQIHPTRTYSLKPNQITHLKYNNYDYVLRTNSYGLPGPEIDTKRPTPDTLRVLVLGNAFSMPEAFEYKESYPALLEKHLGTYIAPQTVQVINAGVTGYSFVEEYNQLKELGPQFKPDVVILQLFKTEFYWGFQTPEDRLQGAGLIRRHNSIRKNLFGQTQVKAHVKKIGRFIKEKVTGIPGRWRYGKLLLHFYLTGKNVYITEERMDKIRSYLSKIKNNCRNIGAELLIIFVPGAVVVSQPSDISHFPRDLNLSNNDSYDLNRPLRSLRTLAGDQDIPFLDLTPYLKKNPTQPVYFRESWHWNKEGHKVAAKVIAKDLLDRGLLSKKMAAN
jgi:peptidoglycan/LPS O-acetylase OafA/YrhL